MKGLSRGALIAYALICTVWGSTYLAIRVGVEHLPPFLFAGIRFLIAGTLLGGFVLWRGLSRPKTWGELGFVASGGLLFFLIGNGLVVWSEQFMSSGAVSVFVVTVTIWSALVDVLVPGGKTRITLRIALGLAVGLLGALLLVGGSPRELLTADLRGPVALTVASIAWAFGTVLMKRRATTTSPFTGAAIQMLAGGAALTLVGLGLGEAPAFRLDLRSGAALAYLVVFGSIVAFSAYAYAVQHMSPVALGTYAYVNPVVAVLLGWLLLGEPITGRVLLAMALLLGAAAVIQFGDRIPGLAALGARPATAAAGSRDGGA